MDTMRETGPRLLITTTGDLDALRSLGDWLRHEDELRGHLRLDRASRAAPGEMGGVLDVLSIALGSGGAGAVLARSLTTWLTHRHADVKVTVTAPDGRSVEVEAHLLHDDVPGLIREIGRLAEDPGQQG
ncbi:hypothetical protein OG432_01075 [Streptomyces sp. NBC_00442]|uniref:effector-associated constant component EACC1 n=1 Tax=Streptomyces sp. NBC_00442 TaxID=2903651 RepID=UPI002E251973